MIYLIVIGIVVIILTYFTLVGPPFVSSVPWVIKNAIKLAQIRKGEKAVDLGCGDGRIVIALAKAGAEAYGYEINPFLVWLTRFRIRQAGMSGKAFAYYKSLWDLDLSSFDVVMIYGLPYMFKRLEKKLEKELKPGSRVISLSFPFPTWKPVKTDESVYLYKVSGKL